MTDTYTGVLDRIVDGETAVLLLEQADSIRDEQRIDPTTLPTEGRHEGAVFELELEDGTIVSTTYLKSEERRRREQTQERFDSLSENLSDER